MMMISYVAFMFGAGMPILFPIALASMIVLYVTDRLSVAYSLRQPPMYDHTINRYSVFVLLFAPLMYMTIGYWMLTNIEIFRDIVINVQSYNSAQKTSHTLKSIATFFPSHADPLLIILGLFVLIYMSRTLWIKIFTNQAKRLLDKKKLLPDIKTEKLSYYDSLSSYQRQWLIAEELHTREVLNLHKMPERTL